MSAYRNCTALITGADGFLGAHLARALLERGARVVGAVLNRKRESSLSALGLERKVTVEYGDVCDLAFLARLVNTYEVDYCFHLAAVSAVRIARSHPWRALSTNVLGTLAVLEAARMSGRRLRGIVLASSDKAYGAADAPYYEELRLEPKGTYEASKAAAEMMARAYRYEHGLPVVLTRCANLYGPADLNWTRLVPGSAKRALRGEAPVVYAESALARREFLHVEDAASAYLWLGERAQASEHLEYNVGSGQTATVKDLATWVARLAGGPEPCIVPRPGAFLEIDEQRLICGRMAALGWTPAIGLAEGLAATVEWYRTYLHGLVRVPLIGVAS